jgi:methylglutaconyl-CoA hydratase
MRDRRKTIRETWEHRMTDVTAEPDDIVKLNLTEAGVAVVTLNRPQVHNAMNQDMIARLSTIFSDLGKTDGVRMVLLDGAGKSFSAGADLTWMRAAADYTEAENFEDSMALAEMLNRLWTLPQPTVALVHGAALAGGTGLASACDMVIATKDASFGLTEVRLGIIPSVISPYVLSAIGMRAAQRYFLTAERFDAVEAQRLGLVHIVVEDQNALAAEAERLTQAVFSCAPGAIASAKGLIRDVWGREIDGELMADTARRIARARVSPEGREGLAAFLQKRKPSWIG